jgi:anhydro-N-acetylmuramic acid kinase
MSVFVGLMSGTSLDGISAAVVRFREGAQSPSTPSCAGVHRILIHCRAARSVAARVDQWYGAEYCRLSFDLGEWLAQAAIAVLAEAGVPRGEVVAIGSHGQTIWHDAAFDVAARRSGGHRRANGH